MSTWLITGSSSGLGRDLARAVLEAGNNAVLGARDLASVKDLADAHPDTALAVSLDVTDHAQVAEAVRGGEERFGAVDVLVNNAGYGYRAAVEEGDDADVATLFATNFFGPVALIKAVLPGMRARRQRRDRQRLAPSGRGSARPGPATTRRASRLWRACPARCVRSSPRSASASPSSSRARSVRTSPAAPCSSPPPSSPTTPRRPASAARRSTPPTAASPATPARAAQAIITAVEADEPPALLMLGPDALKAIRGVIEAQLAELKDWENTSLSTDLSSS